MSASINHQKTTVNLKKWKNIHRNEQSISYMTPIPTKITPSLLKEIIDQIIGTHIVDFSKHEILATYPMREKERESNQKTKS